MINFKIIMDKLKMKMNQIGKNISSISFRIHLLISIIIRLILICYGQIHDNQSELQYTDVDYKVVADGARYILNGESPFERHTYRYSPLYSFIQIPSVVINLTIGKLIYSTFDIFVAIIIYLIIRNELQNQYKKTIEILLFNNEINNQLLSIDYYKKTELIAKFSSIFWLYNPLTSIISTRGNGDSFSSFFVILTIYFIIKSDNNMNSFLAGIIHGIAIHLRLYPLLFSLAYYLCLSNRLTHNFIEFIYQLIFPNVKQLLLIFGTLITLTCLTSFFYYLYSWKFLYEVSQSVVNMKCHLKFLKNCHQYYYAFCRLPVGLSSLFL